MADKKVAAWYRDVVKTPHQVRFCGLVKINHHVTAENQIKGSPKTDWVHQVKGLKNHILFDDGCDGVGTVRGLNEIFLFPGIRNPG